MTGWHRPDVAVSARDHLAQVIGPESAQQMVDGLIALGRKQRDDEIIAWLGKKAREYEHQRRLPRHACEEASDVLARMADKISRGAVRPEAGGR